MAGDCNHTRGRGELWSRRDVLLYIGAITASAAGCRRRRSQPSVWTGAAISTAKAIAATPPACVVRPEQTEGPYFIDEKLNRSDIRVDPSDKSVKAGVPLRLEFHVSHIGGGACTPLSGAIVDLWHCDALGVYSDVRDAGFDTRGKKFLRGYQQTDAKGAAQFLTIYPGWYAGRAVHIHFKIHSAAPSARHQTFTSQLYFDEAVTDQIFKQAPYNGKDGRRTMNNGDSIFRRDGKELLLVPAKTSQGYSATFDIGLRPG
jgi:protocatechuate 3,4-dioxygenase beta subunit